MHLAVARLAGYIMQGVTQLVEEIDDFAVLEQRGLAGCREAVVADERGRRKMSRSVVECEAMLQVILLLVVVFALAWMKIHIKVA